MTLTNWTLPLLLSAVIGAAVVTGQQKGGLDETGPYEPVENWFKPGFARWAQPVLGVFADTPDRIIMVAGSEGSGRLGSGAIGPAGDILDKNPARATRDIPEAEAAQAHHVLVLNGDGELIEEWTQWNDLIEYSHSVAINPYDPERHVWVVDRGNNQILKFTNDGKKLVMTVGEKGVAGTDQKHFGAPANIAFLPDGSFFIADGYRNTRVVKFDRNGNFLLEWGTRGAGPGQFNLVHSVASDAQGRVYVADRGNNRVQVFDAQGKFLEEWRDVRGPSFLTITRDPALWVTSGTGNRLAKFDLNGKLLTYWGAAGQFVGGLTNPHAVSVDSAGNLYVADAWSNRLLKFKPKAGADRARLIVQ